jgi:hypothetical protein
MQSDKIRRIHRPNVDDNINDEKQVHGLTNTFPILRGLSPQAANPCVTFGERKAVSGEFGER